ncbi:MAG: extracellular solute-binding protein [Treponema sp.]|nr:extracellular solute-binding protein [Treponema sp.]
MKKIASIVLAVAAVSMLAIGCSKKGGASGASGSSSFAKQKKQKDPATNKVFDFDKMEIVVLDWWSDPDAPAASKQQEDEKAWKQWVCDTYNVSIVQKSSGGWGGHPEIIQNFCTTGGDENYIFVNDGRSFPTGMKNNLFWDLSQFKVDWKKSKWNQGVIKQTSKGSSFYGFNPAMPEPRNGVFFNKRILEENGFTADYIYDLQKDGKWTWDTFEEICKALTKDTDNDGIIDQYAMAAFNSEFSFSALDSNNAAIILPDANGKYQNVANSENAMEAWNWIAHMFKEYQMPQPEGSNWDWFYASFINGEAAFATDQEYLAMPGNRFHDNMKDDYGFVCFPLGPKGTAYRTINNDNIFTIPACYDHDRAEKIMQAYDLWSDPVPGYNDPDSWKAGYYAAFSDERAVDETLQYMVDNPNPRFDVVVPGLNSSEITWGICGGYQTPQEAYEALAPSWQAILDDCNK